MSVRTTVVGSWWPRPAAEDDLRRVHRGELSETASREILDRCAAEAIEEQRGLGLTEWTGGEYFTAEFLDHMQRVLTGIEIDHPSAEDMFDYDDFAHVRIVGEIAAPNGLGYAEAYRRESQLPGGVAKATVVGPYEIAFQALDQLDALRAQLDNLTALTNREIAELAAAGAQTIQLDVPIFGTLLNAGVLTAQECADVVIACFDGVNGPRRGLHICSGNMRGRPVGADLRSTPWVEILERLDGVVDVAHIALQYFNRWQEREVWARLPQSMDLAAGIVDEASYWVEPVSKIRERAADWARVVGEERLWLAPSCGFGRHPGRDVEVLRQKVANMVQAAETL